MQKIDLESTHKPPGTKKEYSAELTAAKIHLLEYM